MDIEKLATAALKKSISQTDYLSDFVNDGDKEPSWDGNIYIYADKTKSKKGIRKIPVQVKGEVREKFPCNKAPKYNVSVIDLDNWLRDGGVMLFVVYLDSTGEESTIYYRGLTPVLIRIFQKCSHQKKKISIPLWRFPQDNKGKVSALGHFFENMKKQTSFATAPLYSTEEMARDGLLESITVSTTSYRNGRNTDIMSVFFSDDVYMYANIKGSTVPQPLLEVPIDIHVGTELIGDISVGGKTYYSEYRLVRYTEGMDVVIGKSITLTLFADKSNGKLNFKLAGTLSDYIRDTECMISVIECGQMSITGKVFNFSDIEKEKENQYRQMLAYFLDVKKMLDLLGVNKELQPEDLSEQDEKNLRNFTNALVYNKPILFQGSENDLVYGRFKIANLNICIWADKEKEGYRLQSFFSKHKIVLFDSYDTEKKKPYSISHYVLLKKNDFLEIDNIDYEEIAADIEENDTSPVVAEQLTLFMLEMLKAYDEQKEKDIRLLDLANDYCLWLESIPDGATDITTLNRLQVSKRSRDLLPKEIELLRELRKSNHELSVRCGANLLLGKMESAQDCFDEMSEEGKKAFIEYPICNFGNIVYERKE